jgi:Mg2+/Co2+ transporter CorB
LRIGDYSLEILQVTDNAVKTVRLTQPAVAKLDKPS